MTTPCRLCGHGLTREVIDLGNQPPSNSFLEPTADAIAAEESFPLRVMICDNCQLVQVEESIPADAVFHRDYAYYSSFSSSFVAHAQRYCEAMIERFALGPQSKVIEVASNDGYLLQHFVARKIPCLGIEPAGRCAEAARAKGIDTRVQFFNLATAQSLLADGHAADLTVANNVLAHVPAIDDFVAGFATILKPQGVATFEFPHLLKMVAETQFDTIYHEHYSYLSLGVVERALAGHGLRVFDVEHLATHGGSIRVFAGRTEAGHQETPAVATTRQAELAARLHEPEGYARFAGRAAEMRDALCGFLATAKSQGKLVAGYGAAAKGNTFLNYCGATTADIAFVVDSNPAKQDKLLPGSHIPVLAPDVLAQDKPDLILILPWNIAEEITRKYAYVKDWGGRFVVAVPELRVL